CRVDCCWNGGPVTDRHVFHRTLKRTGKPSLPPTVGMLLTMENTYLLVMSLVVFLPTAGALLLMLFPRDAEEGIRRTTLLITGIVFLLTVWMALPGGGGGKFSLSDDAVAGMQGVFSRDWIHTFNINYAMG